jgi:hypothetical protein
MVNSPCSFLSTLNSQHYLLSTFPNFPTKSGLSRHPLLRCSNAVNRRRVILIIIVVWAVAAWLLIPNHKARNRAERTRRELREQGFKLEFSELDLLTSPEIQTRANALLDFGPPMMLRGLDLMKPEGRDSAMVAWTEDPLPTDTVTNLWPELRDELGLRRKALDEACNALLSGPFRFDPSSAPPSARGNFPSSYLMSLRSLAVLLQARTVLELHDHNDELAWTNLLALTRLVTAWHIEPSETAYAVRFGCVPLAERATWEALQARNWREQQLARLQQEWEATALLAGLPEIAAFARASVSEQCRELSQQPPIPPAPLVQIASDFIGSPRRGWLEMTAGWRDSRYRNHGVYEEESELLLFFREREVLLKEALLCGTWAELRLLPGITNFSSSPTNAAWRMRINGNFQQPGGGFARAGLPLLHRAADAEARRRLTIAALAIERFRLKHGSYPAALDDLAPDLLRTVPVDFMDGQPLHYRRTNDDRFLLYSVGLDCLDDGGQMRREDEPFFRTNAPGRGSGFFRREGPDLLWPLAAKK